MRGRLGAWAPLLICLLICGAAALFVQLGWGSCLPDATVNSFAERSCRAMEKTNDVPAPIEGVAMSVLGLFFAAMGGLISARVPGNALGKLFSLTGLIFGFNALTNYYTVHGLVEDPGSLPLALVSGVASEVLGGPIVFVPFVLFFLLYPSGEVVSPRWRPLVWIAVASAGMFSVELLLKPGPLRLARGVDNPIGVAAIGEVRGFVDLAAATLVLIALIGSVCELIIRFRRSRGIERQQMKWFVTAAAFAGTVFAAGPIFWANPTLDAIWGPLWVLAMIGIPFAAAMAIARHRLYEIDLIINRTLVYGLLSAVLAGIYVGLVFAFQALLAPLTAESDLAIAASTLAVAAMFRPARSRVQTFIDRRFYRRKVDAQRTLDEFTGDLRDEVDLSTLSSRLTAVVQDTMQPTHVSLWLRQWGSVR